MSKRLPMVSWFNPILLLRTGIRVAISNVFGEFADRREAIAAANAIAPQPFDKGFDYSAKRGQDGFWFDFLADTGDGWDPTFAMAQLVTEPRLEPQGIEQPLPRGQLLILGGDQVYPAASRESYHDRFLGPFDEAYENLSSPAHREMPDLYAIPGNHDWYDGLSSFFGIFCRRSIAVPWTVGIDRPGRSIAGRPTLQTRSYFALKLPGKWWLWGTDSQLKGYIDQPQIDYFQYVASAWMEPGSNLILCVAQPSWVYVDAANPAVGFDNFSFANFSYLERLVGVARDADGNPKGHRLRLVLTGDSHHYSRYREADVHYVTCGGGGAFLHPTHHLKDKEFEWEYPPANTALGDRQGAYRRRFTIEPKAEGTGTALFPDRGISRRLTWWNLGFGFRNWGLTAVFFAAYVVFNWLLAMNARIEGYTSLVEALTRNGEGSFWDAVGEYVELAFISLPPSLLVIAAFGGYYYFADAPTAPRKRMGMALAHGLPQTLAGIFIMCLLIRAGGLAMLHEDLSQSIPQLISRLGIVIIASLVAAIISGTIVGLYLLVSLNCFGRHWGHAFASLAIKDYKSFLRMRIDEAGKLSLYAIGLTRVPDGGGTPQALDPHIIEGPLVIDPAG